jgi:predicted glycogen debranching enzyme
MPVIRCDRAACADLERALSLEWLETNGIGGFASATICGANTRRYHGLLTAALHPPVGRAVLLSKIEETVWVGERAFEISVNRYPGAVYPQGHRWLKEFRLDPLPTFVYELDGVALEKRVFMPDGENATVIEYEARGGDCRIELRPLIAFRDYHATTHRNEGLDGTLRVRPGSVVMAPYAGMPELHLAHEADAVEGGAGWYLNFEYDRERERGLDCREDLYNPVLLRYSLRAGVSRAVIASLVAHDAAEATALREAEVRRRASVRASAPMDDPLVEALTVAADQFIVRRGELKTVIAGYHWFSDWGRDTMIALPGLTLAAGRFAEARAILEAFAASMSEGMLPNRFPDAGDVAEYNTVDATLWFFEATRAYLEATGDREFVLGKLYVKLRESIDWHVKGTRYGIGVDSDGLLRCGAPGWQLTWMDARVGEQVVTPRSGKPVEIQALWYNALRIVEDLAGTAGDAETSTFAREMAGLARMSFNRQFWNGTEGCLYDVVDGEERDGAIRPNQIFAVSLQHSMLDGDRARQVVEVVDRELRTPLGLRSLSPRDSRYRPVYEGDVPSRDSAYHQGTVWPWLMGPFISAWVKVTGRREEAAGWLEAFREHLGEACLGHISEIADGAAPHAPRGCVAQAWSTGELLRAIVSDVYVGTLSARAGATAGIPRETLTR